MPAPGEEYFNWLCAMVQRCPFPLYYDLLKKLHTTEFVWQHPRDENRAVDGSDLRGEYERVTGLDLDRSWDNGECSVLEMLVAFSRRAEFQTGMPVADWFWQLIQNLDLDHYRQLQREDIQTVEDILYDLVWRQYEYSGKGGLFPMRWPKRDQREVEIWYQFCDYVDEEQLI